MGLLGKQDARAATTGGARVVGSGVRRTTTADAGPALAVVVVHGHAAELAGDEPDLSAAVTAEPAVTGGAREPRYELVDVALLARLTPAGDPLVAAAEHVEALRKGRHA